jgi:imidazolonepropionase
MNLLIKNIKQLLQVRETRVEKLSGNEMKTLPCLNNAWLLITNGLIADFGKMEVLPSSYLKHETIDAHGKLVFPSWCDSHTHIVYAGSREQEFVDRINGLSYEEIAKKGGGILNSAKKLQQTSEDELYEKARVKIEEVMSMGTGAIEIKSGYGLTVNDELKILRVIKKLKSNYPVEIKSTFLGAHAIPLEYKSKREEYIKLIIEEMIPFIGKEKLADYIDVFCESNYFSVKEMEEILEAGKNAGLIPKVHVNQFTSIGGIQGAVKHNALSVDHLEVMTDEDIEALKDSDTMPTLLPSCSFFINIPFAPARKMIDSGLPVALATDYNPGSSPSGNMNFVISLACIKMKMTPEEAINAATLNAAFAMGLSQTHGSITKGKAGNVFITNEIPGYTFIPYSFGFNHIEKIIINGKLFKI